MKDVKYEKPNLIHDSILFNENEALKMRLIARYISFCNNLMRHFTNVLQLKVEKSSNVTLSLALKSGHTFFFLKLPFDHLLIEG